jgi:predicted  nucleic acid-binding Zn-ribbon protein
MMGSTPPSSPDSSGAVLSLLTILGDPERAKAKLAELGTAQVSMEQATAAHNKALYELNEKMAGFTTESSRREADISRRHSEVTTAASKLVADAAVHQDALTKAKVDLDKRERQLAMETLALNQRQNLVDQNQQEREQSLTAREAAAAAHEKELNERHTILDDLHDEAMKLKADAEKRFASLRSILDTDGLSAFTKGK